MRYKLIGFVLWTSLLSALDLTSNLPLVIIDTGGQKILNATRISADMKIIYKGEGQRNALTDTVYDFIGKIDIEIRGSSTRNLPKKQYRFETKAPNGEDLNVSLLGLPEENDWIFNAPYTDRSLIRNSLAYQLSLKIGRYASRTKYCELVLNDTYQGIYILMEKIKRDKNRVQIAKMDSTDITGHAVTGGYIIKIDKEKGENLGGWESAAGTAFQYHYPKPDKIVPEQEIYIQQFMDSLEQAVLSNMPDFLNMIDLNAFVDHFLLNEFSNNGDAYRISSYYYKKKEDNGGRLYAGPIWDFNLSFGNAWFDADRDVYEGWTIDFIKNKYPHNPWQVPFWWNKLRDSSQFYHCCIARWNELRETIFAPEYLYTIIDSLGTLLSEARARDAAQWPYDKFGLTYSQEIDRLKQWIQNRQTWIDENIASLTQTTSTPRLPLKPILCQNYPNPFNPKTVIRYQISAISPVTIHVFDSRGRHVKMLVNRIQSPGLYTVEFNASELASGVYFYTLTTDRTHQIRKLLLLR